jgi:hypothetical protein
VDEGRGVRGGYLRTNEHEEAVRSLEWAELQARMISTDSYHWKWVLISMHNAVQGFMVLALWSGNGLLALRKDSAVKWLEAYETGGDGNCLKLKLDDFTNPYKKILDRSSFSTVGSGPFRTDMSHGESMRQLNNFRDEFIHFTPKGWSLQLVGLPRICMDALDIVEFFGLNSAAILWHNEGHGERVKQAAECLRRSLMELVDRI